MPLKYKGCAFYGVAEHGCFIAQKACQHRDIPDSNRTHGPDKKNQYVPLILKQKSSKERVSLNNGLTARMHELSSRNLAVLVSKQQAMKAYNGSGGQDKVGNNFKKKTLCINRVAQPIFTLIGAFYNSKMPN